MFETPTPGSGKRFIEDVTTPEVWTDFNVGNDPVKQKAIGYLDNQYFRHVRGGRITVEEITEDEVYEVPVRRIPQYTRIPPLSTLANVDVSDVAAMVRQHAVQSHTAVAAALAAACAYLAERFYDYRQTASAWYAQHLGTAKWVAPVSVVSGVLVLGTLASVTPAPTAVTNGKPAVRNSLMAVPGSRASNGSSSSPGSGSSATGPKTTPANGYSSSTAPTAASKATIWPSTPAAATSAPAATSTPQASSTTPSGSGSSVTVQPVESTTQTVRTVTQQTTTTAPATSSTPPPATSVSQPTPAPAPTVPDTTNVAPMIDPVVSPTMDTVKNVTSSLLTP